MVNRSMIFTYFKYFPVILILIYLGARTNRTLNPENIFWGTFDFEYLIKYILNYTFGVEKIADLGIDMNTQGRGGSVLLLFQLKKLGMLQSSQLLFGNGISA